MTGKVPGVEDLAAAAASAGNADIYLYNGPICDAGFIKVVGAVSQPKHTRKAILLLTTYGGDAGAAYRIARWFQRFYPERLFLCPTSVCASAGTLLAIGANSLIMSPFSELGPLDVQLTKRNELGERESGLVKKAALEVLQESAFEFWEHFMLQIKQRSFGIISFDKCAEIASSMCGRVFAEMYSQVDPNALGHNVRDMQVATEYGLRLAKRGGNIEEDAIHRLVNSYPSHDFVIDFEEAAEIFKEVSMPSSELTQLIVALGAKAIQPQNEVRNLQVERVATAPSTTAASSPALATTAANQSNTKVQPVGPNQPGSTSEESTDGPSKSDSAGEAA